MKKVTSIFLEEQLSLIENVGIQNYLAQQV